MSGSKYQHTRAEAAEICEWLMRHRGASGSVQYDMAGIGLFEPTVEALDLAAGGSPALLDAQMVQFLADHGALVEAAVGGAA